MLKTYKEELVLRTCHCDLMGTWRPSAILETMQETAINHASLIGLSRNALLEKNAIWVVSRCEVVMDRYPKVTERISIETFPMPMRRWFFPRYFIFRDDAGNEIGRAGSLWAMIDLNTRHLARIEGVQDLMPDNSDLSAPLGLPSTVCEVPGELESHVFQASYTDLDCNMHVNNTKYMDWVCNTLGVATMEKQVLSHFSLNYNREIRPYKDVTTELRRLGNAFSFSGFVDGERHFDIGGELTDRPIAKDLTL